MSSPFSLDKTALNEESEIIVGGNIGYVRPKGKEGEECVWERPVDERDLISKCTPQQIVYVNTYFETGGNRKRAKEVAGYRESVTYANIESTQAVKELLQLVRAKLVNLLGLSRAKVLSNLQEIAELAVQNRDYKAAVNANKEIAEILGLKQQSSVEFNFNAKGQAIVISTSTATVGVPAIDDSIPGDVIEEIQALNRRNG